MNGAEMKIQSNGVMKWLSGGKLHRESGPAIVCPSGTQQWFLNGKLHREDGPAIILSDGTQQWFLNDKLHRKDGPAIIWPDEVKKEYWVNGKRHREDGPAVIYLRSKKEPWFDDVEEFWIDNTQLSFDEYKEWFTRKTSNPSYQLTDGDKTFIKEYLQ